MLRVKSVSPGFPPAGENNGVATSLLTRARMRRIINPGKMLKIEMGINLRGGDVRVSEHFLHRAQIAAGSEHMAGEGMTQHVRMQSLPETVLFRPPIKSILNSARAESCTVVVHE